MANKTSQRVTCTTGARSFRLHGRDTFLYSGECHYFRIPHRYWHRHLAALREAGCNAVSSYVPWSWHEPKEGLIDLTGRTHPDRNLMKFLDLAADAGLQVALKPGPYALAELSDQGIPMWLAENHPETTARNEDGSPWGPAFVSYASDVFRAKSARWLRHFARKVVLPRQNKRLGAVAFMQLCNEIGMFQWLGARGDYSVAGKASWRAYIEERFPDVRDLVVYLGRPVVSHASLEPPAQACRSKEDYLHYTLWHDYHRWLYCDYVRFLMNVFREEGVRVPFFANVGGWVWGRAHEFPLNGTFQRRTAKEIPGMVYGVDHIPEFVTRNNLHDGIVANEICAELQRGKGPLYSAELQCGSREFGVEPYPTEMGLFYRLAIIHGLTAMNFYMFSGGRNKKGQGVDGAYFYWFTAVDCQARRQPAYECVRQLGEWLRHNGGLVVRSRKPVQVGVGFYPPLHETEFLVPKLQKATRLDAIATGFRQDPVSFRDEAWFDGLLRSLAANSISFELPDIEARPLKDLARFKKLVIVTNEMMDAATQAKLAAYVKGGGELILFPTFPEFGTDFHPCDVLQRELGIRRGDSSPSGRVFMGELKDVPVMSVPRVILAGSGKALTRNAAGQAVGVEKKVGKGRVRFFSFAVPFRSEDHPRLLNAMLGVGDLHHNAWTDPDGFHVEARFHGKEGILFVGNLHRMTVEHPVSVANPAGGRSIDLGPVRLPSQTGLLLPIQTLLGGGAVLTYACAELLGVSRARGVVVLLLRGPKETAGRLMIQSRRRASGAAVDGRPASIKNARGGVLVEYDQTGARQEVAIRF